MAIRPAIRRGKRRGWEGGFLSLTGEADIQGSTDRAGIDQRYGRCTWSLGDPYSRGLNLALDGGYANLPFGELYGNLMTSCRLGADTPVFEPPGYSPP